MGRTVTKQELVDKLADGIGLTRIETQAVVDGFLALVMEAVSGGDRVELRRFGVWKPVLRKGRNVRTPDGLHEVQIPDRTAAVFVPADEFRERMAED
ncbi:MAG: HU family DNA-binding protein [Calditrichaeota bacterium]|nr:HU family DNA-binding protein [Calditrichota bacterium]MCB9368710.1 HU family DNA-binding protein [Calditrichota bacterium]